jgi:hypothetical protein
VSSSGKWRCVDLALTDVSEERIASIFRVVKVAQPLVHAGSPLADSSTLKMEEIRLSETSVNARSTQGHIPEDDILQEKSLIRSIKNLNLDNFIANQGANYYQRLFQYP